MTSVYLTHIDPARNMARFYTMSVQTTLFGECSVVREWGRIGRGGQVRVNAYPSQEAAEAAMQAIERQKTKRGYCPATLS